MNAALAWSPILGKGNFHFAPRWGSATFVAEGVSPTPAPNASGSAMPAPIMPPNVMVPNGVLKQMPKVPPKTTLNQ